MVPPVVIETTTPPLPRVCSTSELRRRRESGGTFTPGPEARQAACAAAFERGVSARR